MVKKLRFWAAYMEEPIMVKDDDIFHHKVIEDLSISDELKNKLRAWDDEYQNTLDLGYPPDSSFPTTELAVQHAQRGRELAERLQEELGDDYLVEYKI